MNEKRFDAAQRFLIWVSGIGTAVIVTFIGSVSGTFVKMRDTLIRMEHIPPAVERHEERLDEHEREIQTLKRQ